MSYIDGPNSEPWEVVENPWAGRSEPIWWVQRHGWNERGNVSNDYEWRFGVTTDVGEEEAEELARRLNEIDRLRAALEEYANRDNWVFIAENANHRDRWLFDEHGYHRAWKALNKEEQPHDR